MRFGNLRPTPAETAAEGTEGVVTAEYSPADSAEAMALDRQCVQGRAYRLSFRRETFHRRAENFAEWHIRTARLRGVLVGTLAAAIKDVIFEGRRTRAGFLFDLRVHPAFRRQGIARRLAEDIRAWTFDRAELAYVYVVSDNRVAQQLAHVLGGGCAGGYRYLVYPTYRPGRPAAPPEKVDFETAHEALLHNTPPFDFYCPISCKVGEGGYVGSWLLERGHQLAGCSAWSNRGILGEIVERIPAGLRAVRRVLASWPLSAGRWPHVPAAGEELRSWYLFDFFATSGELAKDLMRGVEGVARRRDIDYCYIIHQPGDGWIRSVRADLPRLFAPTVAYRLLARTAAGRVPNLGRVYVDIRDL